MKSFRNALLAGGALLFVFAGPLFAAGFALSEYSARSNALAGAPLARADDPSALAYNPAGITQLEGIHLATGMTFIMPQTEILRFADGFSQWAEEHTWIPPHLYYTRQVNDRLWYGVGLFTRFGLGSDFNEDWFGRFNSTYANIQSLSLSPSVAWKVSDALSLSVGLEALWFDLELRRRIPGAALGMPVDPLNRIIGDDIGWGWNVGLHYSPGDRWRFGLAYRSRVDVTVEGHSELSAGGVPLRSDPAWGKITLPDLAMAGVAFYPSERLSVEVDLIRTFWSTYDAMTIHLPDGPRTTPKQWEDVWRYQVSVEYALDGNWDLRLGFAYDESPIPDGRADFIVPANDRKIYSIGFGYSRGPW